MTTSSSSSEWSSTSYRITAGQNLSYSIRRRQRWFAAGEHGSRCTLVSLTIAGDGDDDGSPLRIPCCDRGGMQHEYLDRHATAVARELCRRFPDIPPRYDEHIARTLMLAAKRTDECEGGDGHEEDHDCVICTEEIKTRRSSLAMECSHVFHEDCLVRWLEISHVCPLCRYEMPCCNV